MSGTIVKHLTVHGVTATEIEAIRDNGCLWVAFEREVQGLSHRMTFFFESADAFLSFADQVDEIRDELERDMLQRPRSNGVEVGHA